MVESEQDDPGSALAVVVFFAVAFFLSIAVIAFYATFTSRRAPPMSPVIEQPPPAETAPQKNRLIVPAKERHDLTT